MAKSSKGRPVVLVRKDREAYWRGILSQWARSGLSVSAYSERHGLCRDSLYRWRGRLGLRKREVVLAAPGPKASPSPTFFPVRVVEPAHPASLAGDEPSGVELVLGAGRRLRLSRRFEADTLLHAVLVLERL